MLVLLTLHLLVLEMTDRVYCEQDMRDFSQKYFKINKIFKRSHKVYKNVKYCKQDIDQTDLHNIVAETDGPVSRCALCAQLLAGGLASSTRTMSE